MLIRWSGKAFRLAVMAALFMAVLEVCARWDDVLTWQAPFWGEYSQEQLTFTDALGPRCRPGGQFEKWRLNSFGFRGPEVAPAKAPGVTRVLLVGASETFGLYESPGHEYPAELQRVLDERRPGRFEVVNAACAGMSPPRIDRLLEPLLGQFRPDIVLFYPSPQFYLDDEPPRAGHNVPPRRERAFTPRLLRRIKTWVKSSLPDQVQTLMREVSIDWRISRRGPDWVWTKAPEDRVELFRQHLGALIGRVRALGARPVLATHANRFGATLTERDRQQVVALRSFYPRAPSSVVVPFERAMNRAVLETARENGVVALDLEQRVGKDPAFYADFSHFTDQGAHAMAEALSDELLRLDESATTSTPRAPDP